MEGWSFNAPRTLPFWRVPSPGGGRWASALTSIHHPRRGSPQGRWTPAGRPRRLLSFRAKIAFLYDAFVRLSWPFDLIFELAVPLGQLPSHRICATRGIAIEDGRLQRNGLPELEFVRALSAVHRRFDLPFGWSPGIQKSTRPGATKLRARTNLHQLLDHLATVLVRFLRSGKRFHRGLYRRSALQDVPTIAARVNCTATHYKLIRRRDIGHVSPNMGRQHRGFHPLPIKRLARYAPHAALPRRLS